MAAAVSAPTGEGTLYEVDFRLRPSGNAGPLATHIATFDRYQHESAWVWEHMALTRARNNLVNSETGLKISEAALDKARGAPLPNVE